MSRDIFGERVFSLKGAEEICAFIKEDPKQICFLVEQEGLPAWKRGPNGTWRAISTDLMQWMIQQRNKYLPETRKNLVNT